MPAAALTPRGWLECWVRGILVGMALPGPRSPVAQARVAASLLRNPAEGLRGLQARYGSVVAYGFGPFRYVALFGVEANRYILAEHPEHFRWREALWSLAPVVGDTAVVLSDGDEHRRRRGLVQPAFATKRIAGYLEIMIDEIDAELDTWTPGRALDAFVSLRRVVRRIAVRCLFGDALRGQADELGDALAGAIEFINLPPASQIRLDVPWTRWHRARAARDRADRIVNAEITRRRADPSCADSGDILDTLLRTRDPDTGAGLSDTEIRDQVVSLVAAGYDTTSAAAAWAIHEFLTTPGAWAQAACEIHEVLGDERLTAEHLEGLPHLDAVINETLRLWPPGFVSARTAIRDFEFAGQRIPANSTVLYSPYVTHRLAEYWPEPDRFDPHRWRTSQPVPYSFVPFGGGYRRCIGFSFATQELKVLLTQLLRRVELSYQGPPIKPTGTAALHPRHGLPVEVTRSLAPTAN